MARRRPRWRPPTEVKLPGGFVVPIEYRSSAHVNSPRLGKLRRGLERCGYWDGTRIVVNRDEPVWVQVEIIGHELVHAVNDYCLWLSGTFVGPMQVEAGETALDAMEDGR